MKIKSGFELRNLCGEHIIVASGRENIDFSKVINLNESATAIWDAVYGKADFTIDDMVKALTDVYEVDEATAREDCERMAKEWIEIGIAQ